MPVVVISPFILVVPPASVVRVVALTVLPKLVVPVLLAVMLPTGFVLPIGWLNVMLPVPLLRVRFSMPRVPLMVVLKVKLLLLLVRMTLLVKTMGSL